ECLTGQRAFDGPHAMAILRAMLGERVPRVSERLPDLPAALDEVVATACAKDPARRYPTAQALYQALEAAAGLPPRAAEPGPGSEDPAPLNEWADGDTLFDA